MKKAMLILVSAVLATGCGSGDTFSGSNGGAAGHGASGMTQAATVGGSSGSSGAAGVAGEASGGSASVDGGSAGSSASGGIHGTAGDSGIGGAASHAGTGGSPDLGGAAGTSAGNAAAGGVDGSAGTAAAGGSGAPSGAGGAAGNEAQGGGGAATAGLGGTGGASVVPCGDGYVCDETTAVSMSTGLRWRRNTETASPWLNAMMTCPTTYGPTWRLPTEDELVGLIDYDNVQAPLIDQVTFPDTANAPYWSSDQEMGFAQDVNFTSGGMGNPPTGDELVFRCVTTP